MNGIDTVEWDPETDPLLPPEGRYTAATAARGKAAMKALVQRRLGLLEDPAAPLFVFVGRLTQQKGVDVLLDAAPELLAPAPRTPAPLGLPPLGSAPLTAPAAPPCGGLQLAVLGTGEGWMEEGLRGLEASFPGAAAGLPSFSEELAHWLLAAADFCLVPSRFEPCGLVAQCAARYGAVPVVAAVGGLKDLVTPDVGLTLPPLSPRADGGAAHRADVRALVAAAREAAAACGGARFLGWRARCMELDLSWHRPALEWEALLRRLARLRAGEDAPAPASQSVDERVDDTA